MFLLPIVSVLVFQAQPRDAALAARIRDVIQVRLTSDDDKQGKAAEVELREIFARRGLPSIAAVGEEIAYEFVFVACSIGPANFSTQVLRRAQRAVKKYEIPADAAAFCEAHLRQEAVKSAADKRGPANPALRDQIEQLFKADQGVRQKDGYDFKKMEQLDREHAPILEGIFEKYGVPTYRMVGPHAAAGFATMIQHQSPEFRKKILPGLKANVDAGEADPGSFATVFDRSQTDAGGKQRYGQNLTCDTEHQEMRTGPIEDSDHVDERRAAIGLMRLGLYAQMVVAMSPNMCGAIAAQ
jgi:hypothetical protein